MDESLTYPDIEVFYSSSYSTLYLFSSEIHGFKQRFLYSFQSNLTLEQVTLSKMSAL